MGKHKQPFSTRLYHFLLRLFPFDFRGDFGSEMEQVFQEQHAEAEREGGTVGLLKLWSETLRDFFRIAPREHFGMLRQDVGFALRMMRKNLGYTATAVLTLALGIGANTAIFSVVYGVLVRPLPYAEGDRLAVLRQQAPRAGFENFPFSVKEVTDYRQQNRTLDTLVEYHSMPFILLGRSEPERVQTGVVSANFFDFLGVKPFLGRTFLPGEDQLGAEPVLVLTYEYWQRDFGGDRNVVGRTFEMNDRIHTVVGVLPPVPQFPDENDVYMATSSCPFRSSETTIANRNARMVQVFGRLRPGVTLEEARADLAVIASRLQTEFPEFYPANFDYGVKATLLRDELTRRARLTLLILLATAGFVLLIACANVANLALSRLLRREQELAVRAALGASRFRLLRQLLTESTLLALLGGALGLLLALGGLDLLVAFAARFTPRAGEIRVDATVLLFTLVVSVVTGTAFGSIPALASRKNLVGALSEGRGQTASTIRHRVRSLLVVAQVAISIVLLVGAGLMLRSLLKLQRVNPGFNAENVLTLMLDLNWSQYDSPDKIRHFHQSLLERVGTYPGVLAATVSHTFPLNEMTAMSSTFEIEGRSLAEGEPLPVFDFRAVSPDYFRTIEMPLVRGRFFTRTDDPEAPPVAIINQSMARHYWADEDPLGQRISADDGETWITLVGVVGDVKHYGLDSEAADELYLPIAQNPTRVSSLLVRATVDPLAMSQHLKSAVYEIDPNQPVARIRTLGQLQRKSLASPRLTAILLALFAGLALTITAAGIAGVLAISVSERTQEIGIRMALGATPASVLSMVLRKGMILVLVGLSLGIAGSLALTRLMSGLLYEVEPTDPATFVAGSLVLAAAATAACLAPARRATAIDPMAALRTE